MNQTTLLAEYQKICPGVERIYVIPHIARFSRHNSYLRQLYQPFFQSEPARNIIVTSFSFLSPVIVLRRLGGEQSLLHHHWFECRDLKSLLNALWKLYWIWIYRLAGGKVVWTIHNKYPHERKYHFLNRIIRQWWSRIPHKIHVHCREAAKIMGQLLNIEPKKFFVIPHPPYPARLLSRKKAGEMLRENYPQIDFKSRTMIFLMFGYIAAYKGIKEAVQIFRDLESRKMLVIAGSLKRTNHAYLEEIARSAGDRNNIVIIARQIPEDHVPFFFNACDYALFNYRDILMSGGVALAQSYGKRIIIPETGCLKEIRGEDILNFTGREELKRILREL